MNAEHNDIKKAIEEYHMALQDESLADDDFIEIAIARTNIAKERLNILLKQAKL